MLKGGHIPEREKKRKKKVNIADVLLKRMNIEFLNLLKSP
jgi:hypothetical protein